MKNFDKILWFHDSFALTTLPLNFNLLDPAGQSKWIVFTVNKTVDHDKIPFGRAFCLA